MNTCIKYKLLGKPRLQKTGHSGFTLVELMIGVVIIGILMSAALPSFQDWMLRTKVRTAAESILNGLQRARAEAVSTNNNVEFVLGVNSSWVIKVAGVGGTEIEARSGNEGSKNVTRIVSPAISTTITFNNLGRIATTAGVATNADGSAPFTQIDLAVTGSSQVYRIMIGVAGNPSPRMCDPGLTSGYSAC